MFCCYFGVWRRLLYKKWSICLLSKGLLGHQKTCFRMKTVLAGLPLTIAANQNSIYELLTSFNLRIFFRPSVISIHFIENSNAKWSFLCNVYLYLYLFLLVLWYLCKNTHTLKPITLTLSLTLTLKLSPNPKDRRFLARKIIERA